MNKIKIGDRLKIVKIDFLIEAEKLGLKIGDIVTCSEITGDDGLVIRINNGRYWHLSQGNSLVRTPRKLRVG